MRVSAKSAFLALSLAGTLVAASDASAFGRSGPPEPPFPRPTEAETKALTAEIIALLPGCVSPLESRFGIAWPRDPDVGTGFDGLDLEIIGNDDEACRAHACTSGNGGSVRLEFKAEPFLSGYRDLEKTVCHEMVHAYFRRKMSRYRYWRLPRWAREGSAVYLSGQLNDRLYREIFRNFHDPAGAINGLEGDHTLNDYLEDALAFEMLDTLESGAAERTLGMVLEGRDVFDAIESASGLDEERFLNQARAYAEIRVRSAHRDLPGKLHEAEAAAASNSLSPRAEVLGLYRATLEGEGVSVSDAGEVTGEITPAAGKALYEAARLERYSGAGYERSYRMHHVLLDRVPPPLYGSHVASVRYRLAWLALRLGRHDRALKLYSDVHTLHIESPNLRAAATMGIARTYFSAGRYTQALEWLEAQRDDGTHVVQEVRYKKALSHFHLCRRPEAEDLLEEVIDEGRPSHVWVKRAQDALNDIRSGELTPERDCSRRD